MKHLWIIVAILIFSGCATTSSLNHQELRLIPLDISGNWPRLVVVGEVRVVNANLGMVRLKYPTNQANSNTNQLARGGRRFYVRLEDNLKPGDVVEVYSAYFFQHGRPAPGLRYLALPVKK